VLSEAKPQHRVFNSAMPSPTQKHCSFSRKGYRCKKRSLTEPWNLFFQHIFPQMISSVAAFEAKHQRFSYLLYFFSDLNQRLATLTETVTEIKANLTTVPQQNLANCLDAQINEIHVLISGGRIYCHNGWRVRF